jgi:diketogulonate reductase-like aldo/keto reductase
MTTSVPSLTLNNGVPIPQLGFGVFLIRPGETARAVTSALEAGYRLIDTAQGYKNEEGVGEAIAKSDVPRDEVFVTTKLVNGQHGYDRTLSAFDGSVKRLGVDVIDLFLIHWPLPMFDQYVETWRALEKLLAEGRVRSIGVSNFEIEHLERLASETDITPALNQVELHPRFPQEALREYHDSHGILTEAWAPLGQNRGLLDDSRVIDIAKKVGRTPAQVVLRWHIQIGNVVIPKSVNPGRIRENIDVFDFELDQADMAAFAGLDMGLRLGPHPNEFKLV